MTQAKFKAPRSFSVYSAIVASLFFYLLPVTTQASSFVVPTENDATGNSVFGTIVDAADSGIPVHPVSVYLLDPVSGSYLDGLTLTNNADGSYTIDNVPAGSYKILYDAFDAAVGYTDMLHNNVTCYSCSPSTNGDILEVVEGDYEASVQMVRQPVLSGRVTNESSQAMADVSVELVDASGNWLKSAIPTDENGDWSINVPGPGTFYVRTAGETTPGYQPEVWNNIPCDGCDVTEFGTGIVVTNVDVPGLNFELTPKQSTLGLCGSGDLISKASFEDLPGYSIRFESDSSVIFTSPGQSADFSVAFEDADGQPMSTAGLEWCLDDETNLGLSVSGATATVDTTGFALGSVGLVVRDPETNTTAHGLVLFANMAPNASYVGSSKIESTTGDQVVLTRDADTSQIQVGDIIVSGGQSGVLARVLAVTLTDTQVILTVEPVKLTDAFQDLEINTETEEQTIAAQALLGGSYTQGLAAAQNSIGLDQLQCVEEPGRDYTLTVQQQGGIDFYVSNLFTVQLRIANSDWKLFSMRATQTLDLVTSGGEVSFESTLNTPPSDPVLCFLELQREISRVDSIPGWVFELITKPRIGLKIANATLNADFSRLSVPTGRLTSTASEGVRWTTDNGWEKLGNVISDGNNIALGQGIFKPVADSNRIAPDPYQNYEIDVSAFGKLNFDLVVSRSIDSAAASQPSLADASVSSMQDIRAELEEEAEKNGQVSVIVGLDVPLKPEGYLKARQVSSQRAAIQSRQDELLNQLPRSGMSVKARYRFIPFMALRVDANALRGLYRSPLVSSIQRDHVSKPSMVESNNIVRSPIAWADGYDGAGTTVAVLDTGVDLTHPWFANGDKIVAEACYSYDLIGFALSVCPGGGETSTAAGSGGHCLLPYGCDHGTHVAGTAAGNDGSGPGYGVARGADIVSMQVFFELVGCEYSPTESCLRSQSSDRILAMEKVRDIAATHNIVAVNMSLGVGRFYDQASCDASNAAEKAAIDNLRSLDIATIISSGNKDYRDSIGAPGCISSAVSVGATNDSDQVPTWNESKNQGSNVYPYIHLLAPGTTIESAVPGGSTGTKTGTSMAAPHVAGAWAILKSAAPWASVSEVLYALQSTGKKINDSRSGGFVRNMPRIDIPAAIEFLLRDVDSGLTSEIVFHAEFYGSRNKNERAYEGPKWELYGNTESQFIEDLELILQSFLLDEGIPAFLGLDGDMFIPSKITLDHSPDPSIQITCVPSDCVLDKENFNHQATFDLETPLRDSDELLRIVGEVEYRAFHETATSPDTMTESLVTAPLIAGRSTAVFSAYTKSDWPSEGAIEVYPRVTLINDAMNGPDGQYPYAGESKQLLTEEDGSPKNCSTTRLVSNGNVQVGGSVNCGGAPCDEWILTCDNYVETLGGYSADGSGWLYIIDDARGLAENPNDKIPYFGTNYGVIRTGTFDSGPVIESVRLGYKSNRERVLLDRDNPDAGLSDHKDRLAISVTPPDSPQDYRRVFTWEDVNNWRYEITTCRKYEDGEIYQTDVQTNFWVDGVGDGTKIVYYEGNFNCPTISEMEGVHDRHALEELITYQCILEGVIGDECSVIQATQQ